MKRTRRNVSKKIKNGTTLQTRDEYLGYSNYKNAGHLNPRDLYRKVVVVDSNKRDELAVVKLTTKGSNTLPNYKKGKSTYKPIVETHSNGKKIKIDKLKFVANKSKDDVSINDVNVMKKKIFKNSKLAETNRNKVRSLKGRKKGTT